MSLDFDAGEDDGGEADVEVVDEIGSDCGAGGSGKICVFELVQIFHIIMIVNPILKK